MLRFKHLVLIAVAAVIGVVVGYVIVAGRGTPSDPSKPTSAESGPLAAGMAASPGKPTATTDGQTSVPDLGGRRLPDAEAQLSAAGFRNVQVLDASPEGRLVLEKENWVVDSQIPAAGAAAPTNSSIVLRVKKNTDDAVPVAAAKGVVPNVVCAELQAAQDSLRGSGFFLLTSTDGTGQGRVAAIDRNWVVIGQSAQPGTSPGLTTHIVLTIVKHGESTGSSGCKS